MADYITHLQRDKVLRQTITGPLPPLPKARKPFDILVASIMSQQLSTRVADVILDRYVKLHGGKHPLPEEVLETPHDDLRKIGLSNNKARYIKNVASFAIEKGITLKQLNNMSDAEVITYLTEIKGVGRWTVEMFMIFHLDRPDVLSLDDLGIQQAIIQLYGLTYTSKKQLLQLMEETAAKWAPYRSYACRYLWKWKDDLKKAVKVEAKKALKKKP